MAKKAQKMLKLPKPLAPDIILVPRKVRALTPNQEQAFRAWGADKHLLLQGAAGTGKSFISLHLTLTELFKQHEIPIFEKILIIRSVVPSREIGFLPGSIDEKIQIYEEPYRIICNDIFRRHDAYEILKSQEKVVFETTSYLRGVTLNKSLIIVDEIQNMSYQELSTVITRVGEGCRVIFSGDFHQSDLCRPNERDGIKHFTKILALIDDFEIVNFTYEDIVRSALVKKFLMAEGRYRSTVVQEP